jgi:hypothetical protein
MHKSSTPTTTLSWRSAVPSQELTPIVGHALDAFYEFGYHGTSARDIALHTVEYQAASPGRRRPAR